MWNTSLLRAKKRPPRIPDGLRVYAIGDVHGRADLLANLLARIDVDRSSRPAPQSIEIFLGDYIDRGPNSRDVLDLLISRRRQHKVFCLKGNHETFVADFLADPSVLADWGPLGGIQTLLSYGLSPSIKSTEQEQKELSAAFGRALPPAHIKFLKGLPLSFTCGDYFFVHAGVRPGTPFRFQLQDDLLWIREDFLLHEDDFEKIVVHGHSPVREPDFRSNRINIDTGAYATGQLTCLKLERDGIDFV